MMAKGGVIGSNWTISGNGANGVSFVEFHPRVEYLLSEENAGSGVSVSDSSNVELSSYTHPGTELTHQNQPDYTSESRTM